MPTYKVVQDGKEVMKETKKVYEGLKPFGDYTAQPKSGKVELWIDDELIGVQTPKVEEV